MSKKISNVDKISNIVIKCWDFQSKKKNFTYHQAVSHDAESEVTHLMFCPEKREIVGGAYDGRLVSCKFLFHIGMFFDLCNSSKIHIVDMAFCTKNKNIECETLIAHLLYRKKQYAIRIFAKPAKDVQVTSTINHYREN